MFVFYGLDAIRRAFSPVVEIRIPTQMREENAAGERKAIAK